MSARFTISVTECENVKFKNLFFEMNPHYNYDCSYIKCLIIMNYVEATHRRQECTTLFEGNPYKFVHRSYVVGTKVLACRKLINSYAH